MDFSEPLGEAKIKWGALSEKATTNYYIRGWRVAPDGYPDSLVHLPLRVVYSPQNYGPGKFTFSEFTHGTDSYEGDHTLYAGYLMVDIPFEVLANRFRFTGGARLENFEQNVNTKKVLDAIPFEHNRLKNVDILPSMNLTYSVTETMNLRLAYSHSVNRPEFRERSESVYEDFIKNELVTGDPSLQRSYIHNYDVRFEIFPAIGELIALSYFEKHISGAIEQELFFSGTRTRKPFNSGSAKNSGWEIELRKSFSFVNDYLSGFFVTANYTRVISRVEFINTLGNSTNTYFEVATRPMQGQSPYMINVALTFTEPTLGTSVSISYNKAGRRLDTVGFLGSDIYEEPRDIVDIAVNQPIGFGVEAKLTIKNLNGKDKVLTRDGVPYEQLSTGTTYGFQLSVSL
jgi:outer membrane receptor protein involved in Fe transport